ncbi:General stress protein 69 [Pontiella desulfatans]|uniref:General stress protein 69 n=1 Tax=Pontiella desulfatans TaxID=2750659 RepID=A0A6C2U8V6_PONDE|nr:aldo/keto reductase [Pontiella desulfatans]VGO16273.1 General stress protein 69 [Pontiella desulfatans]
MSTYSASRRTFNASGTLAATLLANSARAGKITTGKSDRLGNLLPTRPLADTGESLTLLGVGGAHIGRMEDADAQACIERALEEGVRFFDNAYGYSRGNAETLYGKYLCPKYRDDTFIMTKSTAGTAATFIEQFELSLKRLNTDYVDLLYLHSFKTPEEVDEREMDGVFEAIKKFHEQGKARYLGWSCHTHPDAALHFLDKTQQAPFTVCGQFPVNPVDAANPDNSFTRDLLPATVKAGQSVIAMKTLAGGGLNGRKMKNKVKAPERFPIPHAISFEENMQFVLSQPITSWVSGMESLDHIRQNTGIVRSFARLDEAGKRALIEKVAGYAEIANIEAYKAKKS